MFLLPPFPRVTATDKADRRRQTAEFSHRLPHRNLRRMQVSRIRVRLRKPQRTRTRRSRPLDHGMSPELERVAGNRIGRRVIIETIAAAEQPFSARYLCEMVKNRDSAVSRTTVYRTLRLLRDRQLVHMTVLQGGNRVFHLDRPAIFWICDDCSRIRTFSSEEVTESLRLFAETKGFHSVEITVEVHSSCAELRQKGFCSQVSSTVK